MSDFKIAQTWINGGGYGSLQSREPWSKSTGYHTTSKGPTYKGVKTWDPWKKQWYIIQTYP
jgi:hypothetical protein